MGNFSASYISHVINFIKKNKFIQSFLVAVFVLVAVQIFTIGVLSEQLPIDVAKPYYYDSKSFVFEPRETLAIDNVDGAISVVASNRTKILVNAEVKGYPRRFKDREKVKRFAQALFQVIESERRVSVETEPRDRPEGVEFRVDYQIFVPPKVNIEINSMGRGSINIGEGCGDVFIRANQSDLYITKPQGKINAQTILGRVDIRGVLEDSEIQTINGSVYIRAERGKLKVNSINGNVQVDILSPEVESCEVSVTNGNITINLPEIYEGSIVAKTHRGYFASDFQLGEILPGTQVRQVDYQWGRAKFSLKLTTMNGKILVSRLIKES